MLDFQIKKCIVIDEFYMNFEFGNYFCFLCIEKELEVWEVVDFFVLMDIVVLDRIIVIDVCGLGGCLGKVFK